MLGHEQVKLLQELMPTNNYRGVQPLNDRRVSLVVH
jgi:carbonic anhydrase